MQRARLALFAGVFFAVLAAPAAHASCAGPLAETSSRARGNADAIAGIMAAADVAVSLGQFGEACVKYRLVLGIDHDNEAARLGLGEGALTEGEYSGARAHFEAVAQRAPENARALQGIGLSYLLAGDLARAEPALRQSVQADPSLWRAWNGLGVIADTRGDFTAADEAFFAATTSNPDEASVYNNLGLSRMQRGEPRAALESFETALRLRPGMTAAAENRRIALAMTRQYDAALAGVSESDLPAALNNVAVVAARQGDRVVAERLFAAAMTASPRYYELAARNRDALTSAR